MKYGEEGPIKITREQILKSAELRKEKRWARLRIGENGELYTAEGLPVAPDFSVGQREDQKELFIEYEWTFGRGRGLAYEATHGGAHLTEGALLQRYGHLREEVVKDYRKIAGKIGPACEAGTPEETAAVKREIEEFRERYPNLFKERL